MRKLIWPTYGGVYKILNVMNGKVYVGSAANFKSRWKFHLGQLRYGNHHSITLQRAYNKYGERNFMSASNKGKVRSEEARANMSIAQKGRPRKPHSAETKAKIAKAAHKRWANPK